MEKMKWEEEFNKLDFGYIDKTDKNCYCEPADIEQIKQFIASLLKEKETSHHVGLEYSLKMQRQDFEKELTALKQRCEEWREAHRKLNTESMAMVNKYEMKLRTKKIIKERC